MTSKEAQLLQQALEHKLFSAEKRISVLRLVLILFNSVIYLALMRGKGIDWLAYTVIVVANVYSVSTLAFELYKKLSFLRNIYFTTISDGVLIAAWISATGFMESPFYVIWYVSIIAVAFRYSARETAVSTIAYMMLYGLVYMIDSDNAVGLEELLVRLGYIPLAGLLGVYVSIEITDQIDGKVKIIKGEEALKKAHAELEMKVQERTQQLTVLNKDLLDSINYAHRIQTAVLPDAETFKDSFSQYFVFHQPKDVISGDFHWLQTNGKTTYISVVDCTGHGVPGALMSMIGNSLLNQSISEQKLSSPAKILAHIDAALSQLLKKDAEGLAVNDGMDMSLCKIDPQKGALTFAGAHGHGILIQKGKVIELEPERHSLGGLNLQGGKQFKTSTFTFDKGDSLYLFTDGFQDQFGGARGKKFYRKKLVALIKDVQSHDLSKQREVISNVFKEWKGDKQQVDDVTVVGVQL